jgi:hypothetical protein
MSGVIGFSVVACLLGGMKIGKPRSCGYHGCEQEGLQISFLRAGPCACHHFLLLLLLLLLFVCLFFLGVFGAHGTSCARALAFRFVDTM